MICSTGLIYEPSQAAVSEAQQVFAHLWSARDEEFGNARLVKYLFEGVQQQQANRLATVIEPTRDDLVRIELADMLAAAAELRTPMQRTLLEGKPPAVPEL